MAKLVHLTILIKKLDTQTNEEFHKYWQFEHPKAWLSVKIVQEKVIKYSHVFHLSVAFILCLLLFHFSRNSGCS
jgi:hypothetical protein